MNPVTFNAPFVQFLEAMDIDSTMLQSPLIQWDASQFVADDSDQLIARYDEGPNRGLLRLPFSTFRLSGKLDITRNQRIDLVVYTSAASDAVQRRMIVLLHFPEAPGKPTVGYLVRFLVGVEIFPKYQWRCWRLIGGKAVEHIRKTASPDAEAAAIQGVRSAQDFLELIAVEFLNPHIHLCYRAPQLPKGRHVSWQKAREHYVLLHKSHAANTRAAIGKKTIHDGATIDRVAHSRRAHFRMLRSPKFKNKQGHRIWVQSAWVGPKEWTDRSGQIYRIVERDGQGIKTGDSST